MAPDHDNAANEALQSDDEVMLLAEIVGAYQLCLPDNATGVREKHMLPYCIVKFGNKTIHYTGTCTQKGRDPIWTVSTGSLFLLKVSPKTLLHEQMVISLWTKRNSNSLKGSVLLDVDTYFLGKTTIDGSTILENCKEQRLELPLEDRHGNHSYSEETTMAVRFRLATRTDLRLLTLLRDQGISPPKLSNSSFRRSESYLSADNPVKDLIVGEGSKLPIAPMVSEANETKMVGDYFFDTLSLAFSRHTKSDKETGLRKIRVKPFPDPSRVKETEFLTPLDITKETLAPSQNWVEAGSGSLGTLHLEILSCHNLPNVDVGEAVGNLTDCFVCAVFEDVMVQTPVIDDELSPHWLPWTQRAFRIGIVHPASTLYLGIMDYDLGPGVHEPLGRVAVNLNNFQSNMLYTLKYNIYPTSNLAEREANGSIRIRIRLEYPDEKALLIAALQPRPVFHVNSRKHKTFKVIRYTCFGEHDVEEKFAWAVTRSYIGEVLEYWRGLKFYIGQSTASLVFWRGQVKIASMNLPIHSAILFVSCAILLEKPWLIVPFYSLFVAWFMLATMNHRYETPSPWKTCSSFLYFAEILVKGKSSRKRDRIRPCQFRAQTLEYEASMREWKENHQKSLDAQAALEEKLTLIGHEDIHTEVAGQVIPLDLLEKLGGYQAMLGRICAKFRKVKSIIVWEESMTAFWIAAISLVAGLVMLILPWRFILYHGGRIVVWGFLGPQMKLVDFYLQSSSGDERTKLEMFRNQSRLARIRREDAMKLKDMKCLAFGEYVALIPSFNLPRHYDYALDDSSAVHCPSKHKPPAVSRIPGQQLHGCMFPHTKPRLFALEEEDRKREEKLIELEDQVARLQEIELHLARSTGVNPDGDLPDDLGYEIALCENNAESEDNDGGRTERPGMPRDIKLSLSQTGFNALCHEEAEALSVSFRMDASNEQRLRNTASRLTTVREASWDMDDSSTLHSFVDDDSPVIDTSNDEIRQQNKNEVPDTPPLLCVNQAEAEEASCSTPSQLYNDPSAHEAEIRLTPLCNSDNNSIDISVLRLSGAAIQHGDNSPLEEKKIGVTNLQPSPQLRQGDAGIDGAEDFVTPDQDAKDGALLEKPSLSPMAFLELKLKEVTASLTPERQPVAPTSHQIQGPRQKANKEAALAVQKDTIESGSTRFEERKTLVSDNAHQNTEESALSEETRVSSSTLQPCAERSTLEGETKAIIAEEEKSNKDEIFIRRTRSNGDLLNGKTWIKECPTDTVLFANGRRNSTYKAEEGLEIVALGRLRSDSYGNNDENNDAFGKDPSLNGLSEAYESSDHVQVAMYRP